jgi:hypothetical protein
VGSTPTRFRHILFDNNGNATTKNDSTGITTYAWDFENLMTSVALPASGGTVSFRYDPFGRRIYKSSSSGTSIFAHDGDNLVEETNSSGAAIARYSQGLNIDEPLAMLRSSTISFYQADGLGSVTSLSNAAGALAQIYTFDSFGKQTATSGSIVNSFHTPDGNPTPKPAYITIAPDTTIPSPFASFRRTLSGFGAAQIFINTRTIIQLLMPIRLARCPDPRLLTICINAFRPRRSAVHRRCLAIVAFRSAFLPSRVIESGCDVEKLPLEVETADFQGGDFTDAKAADCGNEKHDLERVGSCVDDPRNVRLVRHSLCVSKRSNRHSDPSRQDGVYRAGRRCRAGAFADRGAREVGLRNARAKGKHLGWPHIIADASRVAALREKGVSWPRISKQLGIGVGTAHRAFQGLSKKPKREGLFLLGWRRTDSSTVSTFPELAICLSTR